MRGRWLTGLAAASNAGIAAITLVFYGWNASAMHAAARNTARFASLWFLLAFAAPGLARWFRTLPTKTTLVWAFVAAHLLHFAVVAALLATFETAHLIKKPGASAAILLIGFALVLSAGISAVPRRASRFYNGAHQFTMYLLFLIFFLAFARNPVKPLRLMAIPFAVALLLRLIAALGNLWNPLGLLRIRSSNSKA